MPITKSARKSLRQTLKRQKQNIHYKKKIREVRKEIMRLAENNKFEEAKALLSQYQKAVDKATKTNVLKKNTASRKKARLSARLNQLSQNVKENH